MNSNHPINLLKNWLKEEQEQGVANPQQSVLSTATLDVIPHGRVVAIRELLFKNMAIVIG